MEEHSSPLLKWGSLVVLSLALAIIIIDTTLLNVSLATIIHDLHTNIQSIQWVISAYSLTLAALTITGGRFGDIFGRKKMFVLGAIIFALGSFITSISNNVGTMIIGESIIEGIGAALMLPATSSLLLSTFHGRERAVAFGVWGGIAGGAAALGPLLGGYLTTNYSWRWGFRINVFVAIILVLSSFIIKEAIDDKERPLIDWLGIVLSATGLVSLVFGVIEASTYGWWKAKEVFAIGSHAFNFPANLSVVPFAIALGVIILGFFLAWESKREAANLTPLVSMHLFKNVRFRGGILATAIISLGQAGLIFILPVYFQAVVGLSAYDTGKALLPFSLSLLVVSPLGAILSGKIKPKFLIIAGLTINVLAVFVTRYFLKIDGTMWSLWPGLLLYGFGMGLTMSQISNYTLSAVPVHEAGEASGLNNTFRQVGSSFGSAVIGAILLTSIPSFISTGIANSTVIPTAAKNPITEAVSAQSSNIEFGGAVQTGGKLSPTVTKEVATISKQAIVDGNRLSLLYTALIALLGLLAALFIPDVEIAGKKEKPLAAAH